MQQKSKVEVMRDNICSQTQRIIQEALSIAQVNLL